MASQKRWNVEVGSASHVVELEAKGDFAIRITVDGDRAGAVAPPAGRSPRREATVNVAGTPVVIVVELRPDWPDQPWIDLFVDGRSLTDDSTIEASRAAAPIPTGSYDDRMSGSKSTPLPVYGTTGGFVFGLAWLIPLLLLNAWLLRHRELGSRRWLLMAMAAMGWPVLLLTIVVVVVLAVKTVLG